MIFIFCIKGVNWERTPDAAWLMCVDNISDGSWAKHMFCSDIDHHGVDGPAKLVMGWSICPQQHNVDIDVAFFDSSLQHFPPVCRCHSFSSLFLMVTWQREIDQARIERKITPWVIVIDNFPPLGLEGHNFGGYRRFIATPPQVTLTLPFHEPIFPSRPNMSITHPPITANSYDRRKHDLVRS